MTEQEEEPKIACAMIDETTERLTNKNEEPKNRLPKTKTDVYLKPTASTSAKGHCKPENPYRPSWKPSTSQSPRNTPPSINPKQVLKNLLNASIQQEQRQK